LKIWELKDKTSGLGNAFPSVQYSLVDVDFRPGGKEAPKIQTVSVNTRPVFTTLNKVDKKEKLEIFHFDTPAQITNAKNIYNNHLRKSDGSPTKTWKRDTFLTENQTRQDILTSVYVSQTKSPRRKLSGSFLSDVELSPLNVLRDTFDNNRLYVITALTVNDKRREYNISEMIEIFTGDIGSSPGAFNSDFNSDFGTDYSTLLE